MAIGVAWRSLGELVETRAGTPLESVLGVGGRALELDHDDGLVADDPGRFERDDDVVAL